MWISGAQVKAIDFNISSTNDWLSVNTNEKGPMTTQHGCPRVGTFDAVLSPTKFGRTSERVDAYGLLGYTARWEIA